MIIEVCCGSQCYLSSINGLIQKANETGSGVQQLMGTISDFGEALNNFELERKASTFKPLSQSEILKLTMIKKSYERHWKSVSDLLAMVDPEMLDSFRKAKIEQEHARKKHLLMLAKKQKERDKLMQQIAIGSLVFIIGAAIAIGALSIVIQTFS